MGRTGAPQRAARCVPCVRRTHLNICVYLACVHTSRCPNARPVVRPARGRGHKRKGEVQSNTRRKVQTQKVHRPGLSRVADGWCVHGAKLFAFDLGRVTPPRFTARCRPRPTKLAPPAMDRRAVVKGSGSCLRWGGGGGGSPQSATLPPARDRRRPPILSSTHPSAPPRRNPQS